MKKALSVLVAICIVMSLAVFSVSAASFTDVADTHWASAAIDKWTSNGVITPKSQNELAPNEFMTRAEVADTLNNLLSKKDVATTVLSRYSDVDDTTPFAQAIANCTQYNIFEGNTDGTFRPNDNISREQFITVLCRLLVLTGDIESVTVFSDHADISAYARSYLNGLYSTGRLNGYPDGEVKPLRNVSRAEATKLIDNIVDKYITVPGAYTVEEGDIVIVTTNGDITITGSGAERIVFTNEAKATLPSGTNIVNRSGGTLKINGQSVFQQGNSTAPTPVSGTSSSGSSGGSSVRYGVVITISGPTKDGTDATREYSQRYTKGTLTDILLNQVLIDSNMDDLRETFDGTGFETLIIKDAQEAYKKGVDSDEWAEFTGKFSSVTSDDEALKTAFVGDLSITTLERNKTYTMQYTQNEGMQPSGAVTTVGGTYTLTVTVSR